MYTLSIPASFPKTLGSTELDECTIAVPHKQNTDCRQAPCQMSNRWSDTYNIKVDHGDLVQLDLSSQQFCNRWKGNIKIQKLEDEGQHFLLVNNPDNRETAEAISHCKKTLDKKNITVISPDQQCRAGGDRKKSFYNLKSKPKHPEFERPDWNPDKLAEQGFFLRGNSEVVCTGCNYKNKLDSYTSFKTSHSPPSSDQFSWMGKFKDYMGTWATGLKPTAVCSAKYSSTPETPEKDHSIYTTHRKKKGSNFKCHYKDDQRETLFDLRTHYGKGHYGLPQYRIITKPNEPVQSNSTNNLALMTIVEDENYQPQFIDEGHLFYWGSKLSEPFKSFTEELERASRGKELALIKQLNSHFRQIINIIKPCPATGYSSDELEMLKELLKTIRNELNQNHVRDIITLCMPNVASNNCEPLTENQRVLMEKGSDYLAAARETITDPLSEIFKDDEHVTEMIWSIIGQPDGSHTISRPPRTGLKRTYSDSDISHPSTSKYMKKA